MQQLKYMSSASLLHPVIASTQITTRPGIAAGNIA